MSKCYQFNMNVNVVNKIMYDIQHLVTHATQLTGVAKLIEIVSSTYRTEVQLD